MFMSETAQHLRKIYYFCLKVDISYGIMIHEHSSFHICILIKHKNSAVGVGGPFLPTFGYNQPSCIYVSPWGLGLGICYPPFFFFA